MEEGKPETGHDGEPGDPNVRPAQAGSVTLTYMPLPGDPAVTKVHDVEFKAYEPTPLHPNRAWLREHLLDTNKNPWFGDGDPERQAKWDEAQPK